MTWGVSDGQSALGPDRVSRWRGILVGLTILVGLGFMWQNGGGPLRVLLAQEDTVEEDSAETTRPPKAAKDKGGSETKMPKNFVEWWLAGGVVGMVICLLSVVAVGFIIEHFITIRKARLIPPETLAELEQMIERGEIDKAVEYCQQPQNQSLASDVILAGLERYRGSEFGFAEYKSAVEEAGEDQTGRLYRKTEVLGVIGAIAPMLGLLGTVLGMIQAFAVIGSSGGTAKPDELAAGIGTALVTTLEGLFVAIPCMVAFSFFRNMIDSLVAEAGKRVDQVLTPLGRKR